MKVVVREVREVGAFGANLLRNADRLGNAEMRGMFGAEERIQHQDLNASIDRERFSRNLFRVGDVAKWADAITEHVNVAMGQSDWSHLNSTDVHRNSRFQRVSISLGLRGAGKRAIVLVENVRETGGEAVQ